MNSDYIRELFENDRRSLLKYYRAFLQELGEMTTELERAAALRDYQTFRDAAHKTKTSLQLFKADRLREVLQMTREVYQNGDWTQLPELQQELLRELENTRAFLRDEMKVWEESNGPQ
ncbi:Hpt domain-containing protein [Flavilitoribacter nigricans]|uniref:HPt domain-containing protein n=1 Tax=Flavilitoribacter nigricans (strain ATCC 23147 / DSM 23189 / NBRC 102662 / NCIMB 1420 / SS-2) TaxID=1122177 RepID=A0A2D0NHE7_FLAN2|nr:Hpt domain-containing protein [Flavilitoribacter nigricans]PHN07924.1 hypothetical protein CRP01_03990 [Flavilitoribacter nigricans DSM 23189 = NBRC 102662]